MVVANNHFRLPSYAGRGCPTGLDSPVLLCFGSQLSYPYAAGMLGSLRTFRGILGFCVRS